MAVLYLTEQGSLIRKMGDSIIIEKDGNFINEIELHRLDTIFIYGNVQFSTQVLSKILRHNIELVLLTKNGRIKGQITPPMPKNNILRLNQYKLSNDKEFKLQQAKYILTVKLGNSLNVLKKLDWDNHSDFTSEIRDKLNTYIINIRKSNEFQSLLGYEGSAARIYFNGLSKFIKNPDIKFPKRTSHPPEDEFNSILSFGYSLLTSKLQSLLDAYGFDPYIGFLHSSVYGRPSLALDLLEPFRSPIVDRFALKIFNLKILNKQDFTPVVNAGYRMNSDSIKKFFRHWEENLLANDIYNKMKIQVESLGNTLNNIRQYPQHYIFK